MTVLDTEAGTGASGGSAVLGDLVAKLAQLIEVDDAELDVDVPLINLGADSIILLEAMAYLEDTYRVEILASQLVEELSTLRLLAGHIERTRADQPTNGAAERPGHREQPEHLEHPEQPVRPGPILDLRTDRSRPEAAPEQPIRTVADRVAVAGDEQASSFVSWTPQHTEAPVTTDAPSPELVATHHDRLRASKAHADRYRSTHADPRSVASFRRPLKELVVPVVANRADGALLWDLDGNELLDMAMGFGSLLLGHNHPAIRNAVAHQLDAISGVGPVSFLGGPLSERISDLTGHQRVSFVTTGTEAVMLALRLARTATGRRKVALFRGAYHGWWDGSLAVPGRDPGDARRATAGTIGDAADDLLLLDWDDASALDLIERHRDELAAVVAEPVQSRRPGCHCGAFLADLRSLTRSSGALLVFDEMITGFRLSAGGAAEHFGVRPDLVTYGKALGGGLPLAAVAGRADVMDLLDGGAWTFGDDSAPATPATFGAGTYAKHPLSMAAAWAFVTEVETRGPDLYEDLEQAGARVERGANAVFERHGVPATLERCGSMMRFMSRRNLDALFGWLLVEGVYLWEGRTMFLSTAHGPDEIDRFVAALDRACGQLTGPNRRPEDPAPSRPAEPGSRPSQSL
jgi:glutamate-1-semialdehyde aminotransferase/acyl carrier protein